MTVSFQPTQEEEQILSLLREAENLPIGANKSARQALVDILQLSPEHLNALLGSSRVADRHGEVLLLTERVRMHLLRGALKFELSNVAVKLNYAISEDRVRATDSPAIGLSPGELQILALIGRRYSNVEIAEELGVTYDTFRHRLAKIGRRFGGSEEVTAAAA